MNPIVFVVLWWIIMVTGSFYTMIKVIGGHYNGFLERVPFGFLNSILFFEFCTERENRIRQTDPKRNPKVVHVEEYQ